MSDEDADDYSTEDYTDDDDEDYDFSVDKNARKVGKAAQKRKNVAIDASRSKIHKSSDNSSAGKNFVTGAKSNTSSEKIGTTVKLADASSFFYKFTCEWYASAAQYGVDSVMSKPIKCKRKFNVLTESIDHLQTHHIRKLVNNDEPLRCAWQDCDSGEFSDEEGIKDHVVCHAKGDKTPLVQNVKGKGSGAESGGKKDSGVTWYTAALHSILSCDVSLPISEICSNNTCYFCRYSSLLSSVENLGPSSSTILGEFRDLLHKFVGCKDNPFKFISCFVALATEHDEAYHTGDMFKDMFWIEDIKESDLKCQKHTDADLASFFPPLYKKCNVCSQNSKRWPTAEKQNLILALDNSTTTNISQIIFVKGREYQLKSVLGRDSKTGNFYASTCDRGNEWTTFRDDSLKPTECDKVLKGKGACMVIYSNVDEPILPVPSNIPESKLHDDVDSCPVSPGPGGVQTDWTSRNEGKFSGNFSSVNFALSKIESNEDYHICCRRGGDFDSVLSQRKLMNRAGAGSCINSVIQALLTTGLSVIVARLCKVDNNCFLCHFLSVSQHVFTSKGKTTEPFELELNRTTLGVPKNAEGNPVDYIKRLVESLASDEEIKHLSSDAKYKVMIRFQRKCPCRESYEALHWTVNPSKKHESLSDLMAQHSLYCDKCNSVTLTEAVQLPETLIITVESDGRDVSLHYPDEMPTRSCRYFLAAVIVSDDNGSHFSTYCRVFGKWMRFDDDNESRQFSCGDVLHLQTNIRVLVYVTKELAPNDVRLSLAKAKELKDIRRPVVVKEERDL